jgi:hypothetical protein
MLLKEAQKEDPLNLEILGRTDGPIGNNTYSIKLFITFVKENFVIITIEEIRPTHIKQIIPYWKNEKKLTGLIRVMFNYSVDEGYLSKNYNPVTRIKKLNAKNGKYVVFWGTF